MINQASNNTEIDARPGWLVDGYASLNEARVHNFLWLAMSQKIPYEARQGWADAFVLAWREMAGIESKTPGEKR